MSQKNRKHKKQKRFNSSISQHKQVGKTLIPPMLQVPNLNFTSWINSRLPDLLWACLVVCTLPREEALTIFKKIAALGFQYRDQPQDRNQWDLTHTQLPTLPDDIFLNLIKIVTDHPLGYAALRPLLLIESLPGIERWKTALMVEQQQADWKTLSEAVARTLNHQSQEATDVRWLTILFKMALGEITVASELAEKARQIVDYPNQGDMRVVRPSIRAMEMAFRPQNANNKWNDSFWLECLQKTDCIATANTPPSLTGDSLEITIQKLHEAQFALLQH